MTETPSIPTVPYSREAEEAVIGAVLVNPEAYFSVSLFLEAGDFYVHRHRWIWEAFGRLRAHQTPIDFLTVTEMLERSGRLAEIGGPAYLTALINNTPTSLHAEAYGHIVEELAVRRRMLAAANQVAKLAYQQDEPLDTVVGEAEKAILAAGERRLAREMQPFSAVLAELYEQVEGARQAGSAAGVPTGFSELDGLLQGMQPSDLLIIAGRPGMGKTSLLLSILWHAAQTAQKRVAFFSLEMASLQIAQRLIAQETGMNTQRIRSGNLRDEEWPVLVNAIESMERLRLFLDDTPALTPHQMLARCRRLRAEAGLGLVVVDYLQLMSGGGRFENRAQEISSVSRQLKALARELNVPVLAAAQLSRAVEQRTDKRPVLSDLRESGSIEQDSDVVMFLYRPEASPQPGLVEIEIAKHRNGPTGSLQLAFRPGLTKFESLTHPGGNR
jgi:replicative DNA helicase